MSFTSSIQYIQCFPHDIENTLLPSLRLSGNGREVGCWVLNHMPHLTYLFMEFFDSDMKRSIKSQYSKLNTASMPILTIYNRYHYDISDDGGS